MVLDVAALWKHVRAMALSVRSTGCTSELIIFFAFFFTGLAAAFSSAHLSVYFNVKDESDRNKNGYTYSSNKENVLSSKYLWMYWIYGYPVLIGIWAKATGGVGVTASKRKNSRNMCRITTFFIFSLILLGSLSYAIYDLISNYLQPALKMHGTLICAFSNSWWTNCDFHLAIDFCLVILAAAFMIPLSLWCVICCCGSLCCRNQVEQEPDPDSDSDSEGQQGVLPQPTAAQGLMTPATATMVPMMPCASGVPVMPYNPYPIVQGNMQLTQSNAMPMMAMVPGSYPPVTGVPVVVNAAGQHV